MYKIFTQIATINGNVVSLTERIWQITSWCYKDGELSGYEINRKKEISIEDFDKIKKKRI